MQLDVSLEATVPEIFSDPSLVAIFCKSPINRGMWTYISSGNFFIRNCYEAHKFLNSCLSADLQKIERNWNAEMLGLFTNGDQDAMIDQIVNNETLSKKILRLDYSRFNTRPFHFQRPEQHFLVHFTHVPEMSKRDQMREFANRFGLHEFLIPHQLAADYSFYLSTFRG
jgi:hypothetical protein